MNGLTRIAIWFGILYALLIATVIATTPARSEIPEALLALLSKPHLDDSWKLLTDLTAPIDSETGPTSSKSCMIQGMVRIPLWVTKHMPGWEVKEWRCVPVDEVKTFIEQHRGAEI